MTGVPPETALPTSPPDAPAYRPFPVLAKAIRAQTTGIVDEWRGRTLFSMPELSELTVAEFKNSIARILSAMADALESNEPPDLRRLMEAAPAHGQVAPRSCHRHRLCDVGALGVGRAKAPRLQSQPRWHGVRKG